MKEGYIIFDFDLTLGELVTDWSEWRKKIYSLVKRFDPSCDYELEQIIHDSQNELIQKYGVAFKKEMDSVNAESEKNIHIFTPNEKAVDFVRGTDKNLYLWSSNSFETIQRYLEFLGIEDKFQMVVAREQVHLLKPDPEGFSLIHSPQVALEEYVLIGDSESDDKAASHAGIRFLHVDSL